MRSIAFLSILYFLFLFLWGFNYNRLPLSEILGLKIEETAVSELETVGKILLERTLVLREHVQEDSNGVMHLDNNPAFIINQAQLGYDILSKEYQIFAGNYSRPKVLHLFSGLMLMTTTRGIYSPLSGEANIITEPPDLFFPAVICHEMAHQRGFAREDEANFISYLACKNHPNPNFQYSGYFGVLGHVMHQLYKHDKNKYYDIKNKYSAKMKKDIQAVRQFWSKYDGTIVNKTSKKIYDKYLKANKQKDGLHSYGRVVDLLIAEHRRDNHKN